ncbi:MAG: hypothetical protein Kow00124_31420 [Anaerolineae bacterium]
MAPKGIGTLGEGSLHAALKEWYAQPGDVLEDSVDGYVIDIRRGGLLIEVQTGNFTAVRRKLLNLTRKHAVRLIYPVARDRWIVRQAGEGWQTVSRRRSPKHGSPVHVFNELVRFPTLMGHPRFSLEVLLIQEEIIWRDDGQGSWRRRGWSIYDRRLLDVLERVLLTSAEDCAALLPDGLPAAFSTADLAGALGESRRLAQRMAYCLREMGVIEAAGKHRNALLYRRCV